ncbi:hypothetical protein VNO77_34245 [Canavalia gladiata]|uniref:Uncharacterized protein n=1 Tax=Canavalia gladiata TaxID=3824 RepID=A0AAN9Q1L5_CANGL
MHSPDGYPQAEDYVLDSSLLRNSPDAYMDLGLDSRLDPELKEGIRALFEKGKVHSYSWPELEDTCGGVAYANIEANWGIEVIKRAIQSSSINGSNHKLGFPVHSCSKQRLDQFVVVRARGPDSGPRFTPKLAKEAKVRIIQRSATVGCSEYQAGTYSSWSGRSKLNAYLLAHTAT